MTEEFEDMIEEVEDEVVEESQSSADPINTEEVVEEDELIVTDEMLDTMLTLLSRRSKIFSSISMSAK